MKKLVIALVLALVMVMALAAPVFADNSNSNGAVKVDLVGEEGDLDGVVVGFAIFNIHGL